MTKSLQSTLRRKHELISTRLTEAELQKIDQLVDTGGFLNRSDFLRSAVRETLSSVQILTTNTVPLSEAKKQILRYLDDHPVAYPSDIAKALGLELSLVMEAVHQLWEAKTVQEASELK